MGQFHKDCRGEDFTSQEITMVRSALLVFSVPTLVAGLPQNLPQSGEDCGSDRLTGVARQEGDSWSPDGCNNCRCCPRCCCRPLQGGRPHHRQAQPRPRCLLPCGLSFVSSDCTCTFPFILPHKPSWSPDLLTHFPLPSFPKRWWQL